MQYVIEFSDKAVEHLKSLRKRDQQAVIDAIERKLSYEPSKETRNKKRLEDNRLAPWELRIGGFRAFFDIDEDKKVVAVIAIGQKQHDILMVKGKELRL